MVISRAAPYSRARSDQWLGTNWILMDRLNDTVQLFNPFVALDMPFPARYPEGDLGIAWTWE
jgi:hypothetical protein